MKKLYFMVVSVLLLVIQGCNSKKMTGYLPLQESETVVKEYDFSNHKLNVYASNGENERLIFSDAVLWGAWQFSADNRQMVFWEHKDDSFIYYFVKFISGEIIKLKIKESEVAFSRNFEYYAVPDNLNNEYHFNIYDFNSNKKIKTVIWQIPGEEDYAASPEYYLSVSTSDYEDCDFQGFVGTDGTGCAIGVFNVNMDYVKTLAVYEEGFDLFTDNIESYTTKKNDLRRIY